MQKANIAWTCQAFTSYYLYASGISFSHTCFSFWSRRHKRRKDGEGTVKYLCTSKGKQWGEYWKFYYIWGVKMQCIMMK